VRESGGLTPVERLTTRSTRKEDSMLGYGLLGTLLIICLVVWLLKNL